MTVGETGQDRTGHDGTGHNRKGQDRTRELAGQHRTCMTVGGNMDVHGRRCRARNAYSTPCNTAGCCPDGGCSWASGRPVLAAACCRTDALRVCSDAHTSSVSQWSLFVACRHCLCCLAVNGHAHLSTRPWLSRMRARSSGVVGLWSVLRSIASQPLRQPFLFWRPSTMRLSPTQAVVSVEPYMHAGGCVCGGGGQPRSVSQHSVCVRHPSSVAAGSARPPARLPACLRPSRCSVPRGARGEEMQRAAPASRCHARAAGLPGFLTSHLQHKQTCTN